MAVYTKTLGHGRTGAANVSVVVYTCPAGQTAILKDVRLSTGAGSAVNATVFVASGSPSLLLRVVTIAANTTDSFQPYVVLEPGDQIKVICNVASALDYWCSGSELVGVT